MRNACTTCNSSKEFGPSVFVLTEWSIPLNIGIQGPTIVLQNPDDIALRKTIATIAATLSLFVLRCSMNLRVRNNESIPPVFPHGEKRKSLRDKNDWYRSHDEIRHSNFGSRRQIPKLFK